MIQQKGQLFFDPDVTGLSGEEIIRMTDEDKIAPLYQIALDHFLSITPLITNCGPKDLQWLKFEYTVPYFADLVFRCRNNVYGVIFALQEEDGMILPLIDLNNAIERCKENNIIPTLLVFDKERKIVSYPDSIWNLLDGEKYLASASISTLSPHLDSLPSSFESMGKWEELNNAVMAYVRDLSEKQKITQCLYQSYPGVDPAICWMDNNGVFNWMMIRTMKDGDALPSFPSSVVEKLKRSGKGHLCTALLSNPNTNGVLPRSEAVDIKMEIEDVGLE